MKLYERLQNFFNNLRSVDSRWVAESLWEKDPELRRWIIGERLGDENIGSCLASNSELIYYLSEIIKYADKKIRDDFLLCASRLKMALTILSDYEYEKLLDKVVEYADINALQIFMSYVENKNAILSVFNNVNTMSIETNLNQKRQILLECFYTLSKIPTDGLSKLPELQENQLPTRMWLYDLTLTSNRYHSLSNGSLRGGSQNLPIVIDHEGSEASPIVLDS